MPPTEASANTVTEILRHKAQWQQEYETHTADRGAGGGVRLG